MSDTATAERTTSTVVTSETLAEFQATKLGLNKPAAVEPGEVVGEATELADPPEGEQTEGEPAKPKNKLENRFSEITAQRRKAEERADREAERASTAERERDELKARLDPKPAATENAPKPKVGDYADAFEYAEDLAEWTAENVLKERDKADAKKVADAEAAKVTRAWQKRVEATQKEMPDYEDTVAASEVMISDPVRDAIIESEYGPKILYLLATDPKIAEKLSGLSILGQLRELGKLEAKFEKPEPKVETDSKPVIERPRAPAPISPVRGTKTADNPANEPGEFKGTFAEWKAARKAGKK